MPTATETNAIHQTNFSFLEAKYNLYNAIYQYGKKRFSEGCCKEQVRDEVCANVNGLTTDKINILLGAAKDGDPFHVGQGRTVR